MFSGFHFEIQVISEIVSAFDLEIQQEDNKITAFSDYLVENYIEKEASSPLELCVEHVAD